LGTKIKLAVDNPTVYFACVAKHQYQFVALWLAEQGFFALLFFKILIICQEGEVKMKQQSFLVFDKSV